jgi:hypothetical protein
VKSHRTWRKLHLAVDAASGMIVAQTLTDQDADDPSQVGPLLDQIDARLPGCWPMVRRMARPLTRRSQRTAMASKW